MQFTLIILLFPVLGLANLKIEKLNLKIGEKTKIKARGDLIMGNEKVLRAKDLGADYEIEALKAGYAEIRTASKVFEISVLRQNQLQSLALLKQKAPESLGLKAIVSRDAVVVEGELLQIEEWKKMASACSTLTCDYKSRFRVPERLRGKIQDYFSALFQTLGYGLFRLRWEPEIQVLIPSSQKLTQEIERIAAAYGITVVQDPQALELAPSIRVQIMILEIKKSEARKLGVQWSESYNAQVLPSLMQTTPFELSAHFLESNGWGKVLANPSLLCRSGKDAEFLAGGEIPIKVMNRNTQDVIWKKYGVLLRLKPQADFAGRMSLGIETEISSLDASHTVDGVPGFRTNRVQSHFDLASPRTIVLSGLISNEQSQASQGIPGLASLPILGSLFSSRDFKEDQTELMILVRPEMIPAHMKESE